MRRDVPLSETALTALFFLAATLVFTWPIAPHMADGLADLWDAKYTAWVLHWDYHQTLRNPLHLFDANIFYPSRYALAFSENLYGVALLAFPLFTAGVSTLTAYNVMFLLGMFLSAVAAWALAREATGDPLASIVAGVVYAFCPWRISQIPHIQFQWGAFLALAALFLLRYLEGGKRRDAVLFGICFAWNALCNLHYAFFCGLLVVLAVAYEGLVVGWPAFWPRLRGTAAAVVLAGIVIFPFFVPYALASRLYKMERSYGEIGFFSGVWKSFLAAGSQNKLYGPITQEWERPEGDFFPGLVPLGLAAVALGWRQRPEKRAALRQASPARRRAAAALNVVALIVLAAGIAAYFGRGRIGPLKIREPGRVLVLLTAILLIRLAVAFPKWSRFADLGDFLRRLRMGTRAGLFVAVAVLGVVVALGTHTPYYRFLLQSFGPAVRAFRVPSRGIVLFHLGLAVLAAWGLSLTSRRRAGPARFAIVAAALLAIGAEYRAFPVRVDPVEQDPPRVDRWLAGVDVDGSVIEWPLATGDEVEFQFRSTAHWKPIINGYSGFFPPTYLELAAMFEKKAMLERKSIPPEVWEELGKRDCRLLILHPHMIADEPVRHVYLAALRDGLKRGRLRPIRSFPHGSSTDLVFEVGGAGREGRLRRVGAEPSREPEREIELMTKALNPPFGFIDSPREDEAVAPDNSGFGWALDDSGVESVLVSIDASPPAPARYGLPHPGPRQVYPAYPDSQSPGFAFAIPKLPRGAHILTVTIVAKDHGTERLMRRFRVPG